MIERPGSASQPHHAVADEAAIAFEKHFGRSPQWLGVAPGRVNLIGEHIDYNDGFVLPVAIDRYTAIAAATSRDAFTRIATAATDQIIDTEDLDLTNQPDWAAYVLGPLVLCRQAGFDPGCIEAWIHSDVPRGAGLSSSAALEVATATLAEQIAGKKLDAVEKAKLCQRAEHQYANVPCGLMDQATSVAASAGTALLIDCREETWTEIPFASDDVCLLVANTNVHHQLSDGQYAVRREQCREALKRLGSESYRALTIDAVSRAAIDETLRSRARHVVTEIDRTRSAAEALRGGAWETLGRLMNESHVSLRDDYQVSCEELDTMAKIAWGLGTDRGVYGSRMTGGGFGGCTVSLVATEHAASIADVLATEYRTATGIEPDLFVVRPSRGATGVTCPPPPKPEKPA